MKREYKTPRAEKLDFDYKKVVLASGQPDPIHGDFGNGRGCGRVVTLHGHGKGCNQ